MGAERAGWKCAPHFAGQIPQLGFELEGSFSGDMLLKKSIGLLFNFSVFSSAEHLHTTTILDHFCVLVCSSPFDDVASTSSPYALFQLSFTSKGTITTMLFSNFVFHE